MKQPWFPRKKYGFGWGFPKTWQGLLVLLVYFSLFLAGLKYLDQHPAMILFFVLYLLLITGLLFLVCWKTGERPDGDKQPSDQEDHL